MRGRRRGGGCRRLKLSIPIDAKLSQPGSKRPYDILLNSPKLSQSVASTVNRLGEFCFSSYINGFA